MRTSVLATVRAFSSQRRRAAGCRAGCRAGSPRARTHPTEIAARIQPDLRIQIVHALSQLDSCTRGWMGGRACDGMGSTARTRRALRTTFALTFSMKVVFVRFSVTGPYAVDMPMLFLGLFQYYKTLARQVEKLSSKIFYVEVFVKVNHCVGVHY